MLGSAGVGRSWRSARSVLTGWRGHPVGSGSGGVALDGRPASRSGVLDLALRLAVAAGATRSGWRRGGRRPLRPLPTQTGLTVPICGRIRSVLAEAPAGPQSRRFPTPWWCRPMPNPSRPRSPRLPGPACDAADARRPPGAAGADPPSVHPGSSSTQEQAQRMLFALVASAGLLFPRSAPPSARTGVRPVPDVRSRSANSDTRYRGRSRAVSRPATPARTGNGAAARANVETILLDVVARRGYPAGCSTWDGLDATSAWTRSSGSSLGALQDRLAAARRSSRAPRTRTPSRTSPTSSPAGPFRLRPPPDGAVPRAGRRRQRRAGATP